MKHYGILTDVTKCIGCNKCVEACKSVNQTGEDVLWRWSERVDDLSANRWTTIVPLGGNRYVRRLCRHCLEPACASACPVGALHKTPEGPVVYNRSLCIGCRYCMMSCPYGIPRYEWYSRVPYVRKCLMCYEQILAGARQEPGCTAACPTKATIFGQRDDLLAEAKRRIAGEPEKYIRKVWGETQVGGTSVMFISDTDLDALPWNNKVGSEPLPEKTWSKLKRAPLIIVGVSAVTSAVYWIIDRRIRLQADRHVGRAASQETRELEDNESQ